ncbi:MAG: Rieske (2Fe-2S) protein [Proteobacteria bacterium]|nr:Rieske (2Fe-2S) protein [Pseudomonadota bacterium]
MSDTATHNAATVPAAASDARTAPVAVWQIVGKLKGEELKAWRVAPLERQVSAQERGIELPMPYGWFVVGWSDELAAGQVKPVRYFGRELVLWRGEDGAVRMLDAWCRHLGAHMGYGGRVQGNDLECPFHAWHYNGSGVVTKIPYSKSIPPQAKRPCTRAWPVVERNRYIWAWYHPGEAEPQFEVEALPETSSTEWTDFEKHEWYVYGPLQNMAENGVDSAHFHFIHGTAGMPDYNISFEGIRRTASMSARMGTPRGEVDGTISYGTVGAGQAWTRFSGIAETLLVAGTTPVAPDVTHVRFSFTQHRATAGGERAGVSRALIRDICKQLDQDKVVWDRQRYRNDPLLCEGDGPIADFRRYYSRFYAELGDKGGQEASPTRTFARKQKGRGG